MKYYTVFDPEITEEEYMDMPIAILTQPKTAFSYEMFMGDKDKVYYWPYMQVNSPYRYLTLEIAHPLLPTKKEDKIIFITPKAAFIVLGEEFNNGFRKFT